MLVFAKFLKFQIHKHTKVKLLNFWVTGYTAREHTKKIEVAHILITIWNYRIFTYSETEFDIPHMTPQHGVHLSKICIIV